ncbi:hypothetical protein LOK49_LG13G01014 [Camellia lanceoleosa]|uniref:Uncharacterized protein n=1 Tax=Camellia lanceoleosa TaxID=1840588 RepID=A0ACC0FJE8_9ERIC|nr:hypothetical protein LOK49_LG13G01014 [Camellia lanceoleosa]
MNMEIECELDAIKTGSIADFFTPPLRLPFVLSRRLREVERKTGALRARPGLRIDLEEIFMDREEEEERREVKQMKSSLVLLVLAVRWGLSDESIIALFRPLTTIKMADD